MKTVFDKQFGQIVAAKLKRNVVDALMKLESRRRSAAHQRFLIQHVRVEAEYGHQKHECTRKRVDASEKQNGRDFILHEKCLENRQREKFSFEKSTTSHKQTNKRVFLLC